MQLIKKTIIVLCLLTALPQLIDISAQPLDSRIIADKSVQSED
ncbi:hypothetical protein GCM10007190_08330 [Macrococcus hajekii]|nr:hypothetical protein [Macrococcus hajekii]GGB02687.1 hypothetical protein GCM10007190_08330 [Macrococcus hajekii]